MQALKVIEIVEMLIEIMDPLSIPGQCGPFADARKCRETEIKAFIALILAVLKSRNKQKSNVPSIMSARWRLRSIAIALAAVAATRLAKALIRPSAVRTTASGVFIT